MNIELMRLRQGRIAFIVAIILLAASFATALLLSFARKAISALISLNDVVPNATQAQSMPPEKLAQLSLDQPGMQFAVAANAGGTSGTSLGALAMMIMGGLFITREYRFASMTTAAIALPRRQQLYANKCKAIALASLAIALSLTAIKLIVLFGALTVQHIDFVLNPISLALSLLRGLIALTLCGVLGTSLGFLLRRQSILFLFMGCLFTVESTLHSFATLTGIDLLYSSLPLSATGLSVHSGTQGWLSLGIVAAWSAIASIGGMYAFKCRELTFMAV